jgi:WD40 repeat protein/transcriptional regulator with XRE-family HTH domain
MPRPERPLDGLTGPVAQFAAELRELREKAGRPGYREMAARVNYSVATLSAAASGRRLPTLEVTLAYVAACDGDPQEWERRWRKADRLNVATAEDPAAANGRGRPPYPGLATFQPADAELFFGRTVLVDALVRRLGQRRFLAVFGPSGSGKSSVLRAGLVPAANGPVVVLTPGTTPMAELAVHLARHAGVPAGGLLDELREDPARAHLMVRQGLPDTPDDVDLLVVVDQFEEVFATGVDPGERADFVAALLAMCREPDGRARVVLAVRADHYTRFTEHPGLLAALTDAQVLIGGMKPAELREAVTRPAEARGARVEGALVATIVAEVGDSPGALPLAAHALREAWHRRQGAVVTLAGYQAAGGMAGAVARTAEQTYERLSGPDRDVARRLLLRMVDIGPDGMITRRRLKHAELNTIEQAPAVAGAFTDARLLSTDRDTVEIAHEALIRAWPRLSGWVEENRAGLRLHRQLTEATATWESLGRDEGALYRGLRLSATAEAADAQVIELTGTEREFLEAARALRDRETRLRRRRTRWLFAGLVAVLAVVCVLAAGAAVSARRVAAERDRAVARELAAGARAERTTDPELALLLASRAYRLHPDAQTESVLRQATADARSILTMDSHSTTNSSAAVSSSRIASVGPMGVITVRDLQGRTPPVTAPVQGNFFAFGPDGRLAIVLSDPEPRGSPIVLWEPGGTNEVRRLAPPAPLAVAGIPQVAYSSDGRWVAATGADSQVHVWDTTGDGPPRSLPYTGEASDLAFGPDGRLVLGADDGTIRIWDVGGTAAPVVIRQPGGFLPVSVAVSPDGDRIAVGGLDEVKVWSAGGRAGPQIYRAPENWYNSVAFSPDGRRIAAGTNERTIRLWNLSESTQGLALRGHQGGVRELTFSPDGRRLISSSDDSTVRVWDTDAAADPVTVALPASHRWAQLSDDGGFVAAPAGSGTIAVFPTRTPWNATTLRNAPPGLAFLAVSASGRSVAATATGSERIHWWRTATGDEPAVLECGHRPVQTTNGLALSVDGRVLAVDCGDGETRLWRAGHSQVAGPVGSRGSIAISPDATLMAIFRDPNAVALWEPAVGGAARTLKGQSGPADHLRFSPDGRLLAAGGNDGTIRIWTVAADDDPIVLTGAVGQITAISFSPDGKLIAGVGSDDVVRLWNTDGSGEPLTFDHPAARQLAFSADGRQLISLYGTTVRFTPCEVCGPVDEVLALAGQRTTRDLTPEERAKYLPETE